MNDGRDEDKRTNAGHTFMKSQFPIVPDSVASDTGVGIARWLVFFLLCLLSLFILGLGFCIGIQTAMETSLVRAMQRWPENQAALRQVTLIPARSSRDLPRIHVEYDTTLHGKTYMHTRTRLSLSGAWERKTYAILEPYWKAGKPFACYVNPNDPREAYLFRNFRWDFFAIWFLWIIIFIVGGLNLLTLAFFQVWRVRREAVATWQQNKGVIQIKNKIYAIFDFCLSIFVVNIWIYLMSFLQEHHPIKWWDILIGILFTLIFLSIVYMVLARAKERWQGRTKT